MKGDIRCYSESEHSSDGLGWRFVPGTNSRPVLQEIKMKPLPSASRLDVAFPWSRQREVPNAQTLRSPRRSLPCGGSRHAVRPDGRRQHALVTAFAKLPGVHTVHVRHEHATVAAATAYNVATGKLAVASVTCGPGVTQLMTALPAAVRARLPMVVFAGEAPMNAKFYNGSAARYARQCNAYLAMWKASRT